MKLKKLSEEHYIIMDDSEIKEGDWVVGCTRTVVQCMYPENVHHRDVKKITHSTKPLDCACSNRGSRWTWTDCAERNRCFDKVQYLPLQEVKELLGVVDVEKKAHNWSTRQTTRSTDYWRSMVSTYVEAYNQALEDNKEKKYTEDDLKKAICIAKDSMGVDNDGETCYSHLSTEQIIQSLQPQTEWEVEIVDGKLKLKS